MGAGVIYDSGSYCSGDRAYGDVYVVNTVTGKDFVKDPGLHRTLLGDGLACLCAGLLGGPPVTTYSEVTGAHVINKDYQSASGPNSCHLCYLVLRYR